MKNIFYSFSLRTTMMIILVLAVGAISYYNIRDVVDAIKVEKVKDNLKELVILTKSLSELIHETKKEREASVGFIESGGSKFKTILSTQRIETDKKIKEYLKVLKMIDVVEYDPELKKEIDILNSFLEKLPNMRQRVSNLTISVKEEVKWYTKMNSTILKIIGLTARLAPNEVIAMDLAAYVSFLKAKERAGIERALLSTTFRANKFKDGMFVKFIELISEQKAYLDDFLTFASGEMKKKYYSIINDPSFGEVERMRNEIDATINVIVQAINAANEAMRKNVENVNLVTNKTQEVRNEISNVSNEMINATKEVEENVEKVENIVKKMQEFLSQMKQIEKMSKENKNNILQNSKTVEKIAMLADKLLKDISQFKL